MDLVRILAEEKASEKVQELPDNFYEKAEKQISSMISEHSGLEADCLEAQLLADAIRAEQQALKSIVVRRISKVLRRAALDAMKEDSTENISCLENREARLYSNIRGLIAAAYDDLGAGR